jgi:hypothetical protein
MPIQYEYNVEKELEPFALPVCVTVVRGEYTREFLKQLATFEQCPVVDYRTGDAGFGEYIYPDNV